MKFWLFVVLFVCPLRGLTATNTTASVTNSASFAAQSRSITLGAGSSTGPRGMLTAYFTTYDGTNSEPLHTGNYVVSGELRPRSGSIGVFETDYVIFSQGIILEYG